MVRHGSLAFAAFLCAARLAAHPADWQLLQRSGEALPGARGPVSFELLPSPCAAGVAVLGLDFGATVSGELNLIYLLRPGLTPELVVSPATVIPGVGRVVHIRQPVCRGDRVFFTATLRDALESAAFEWNQGNITRAIDPVVPPPIGGRFQGISGLSLDGDDLAFSAARLPVGGTVPVQGVWVQNRGAVLKIAEIGETPAGSAFPLGQPGGPPDVARGEVVFRALGPFPHEGVYLGVGGAGSARLFDSTQEVPGQPGWFWRSFGSVSTDRGRMLFTARLGNGVGSRSALFVLEGLALRELAAIGSSPDEFMSVNLGTLDGDKLAFLGVRSPGREDLYYGTVAGWLPVLRRWDVLDGGSVAAIRPGQGDGRLAALVLRSDGSQGIYLYRGSPLEIPTLGTPLLVTLAFAFVAVALLQLPK